MHGHKSPKFTFRVYTICVHLNFDFFLGGGGVLQSGSPLHPRGCALSSQKFWKNHSTVFHPGDSVVVRITGCENQRQYVLGGWWCGCSVKRRPVFSPRAVGACSSECHGCLGCYFGITVRESDRLFHYYYYYYYRRSQWPCGLRRRSVAARLLRSWVRIPPGAWMLL